MVRVKVPAGAYQQLYEGLTADRHREGVAFALAGVAKRGGAIDVLIRRVVPIHASLLRVHERDRVEVAPQAVNGLAALCERNRLTAVLCHSHLEDVSYSPTDDYGEQRLAEVLRPFVPADAPIASLLLTPSGLRGRLWLQGSSLAVPVDEIFVVGPRIERSWRTSSSDATGSAPIFDRQVLAFGDEGQRRLCAARVAVVGVGGTGSAAAEQLVRLGVRDFLLVDPDRLEPSNLTRVYGARRRHVKRKVRPLKVQVVAKHLRAIAPEGVTVRTLPRSVAEDEVVRELLDRDCMFLCTDDHWGRAVLNQLAYQYLIPVINLGVAIEAPEGTVRGAVGVVDVLGPELPCLWCRGFLDPQRIAAESMPSEERQARVEEGYIRGYRTRQPAVVSLTTTVAGLGVTLFLDLLTGFMGEAGRVHRLNWDVMSGEVRRGRCTRVDDCICRKVEGRGDLAPRPTIVPEEG